MLYLIHQIKLIKINKNILIAIKNFLFIYIYINLIELILKEILN